MKILIATDGSKFSEDAIERCAEILIKPGGAHTEVKVISVYETLALAGEPFGTSALYYTQADEAAKANADDIVKEGAAKLAACTHGCDVDITTSVVEGPPSRVIVETAETWQADVIVVGSHGRGFWARNLLGSVSTGVLHHAPCSVLVVRPHEKIAEQK